MDDVLLLLVAPLIVGGLAGITLSVTSIDQFCRWSAGVSTKKNDSNLNEMAVNELNKMNRYLLDTTYGLAQQYAIIEILVFISIGTLFFAYNLLFTLFISIAYILFIIVILELVIIYYWCVNSGREKFSAIDTEYTKKILNNSS